MINAVTYHAKSSATQICLVLTQNNVKLSSLAIRSINNYPTFKASIVLSTYDTILETLHCETLPQANRWPISVWSLEAINSNETFVYNFIVQPINKLTPASTVSPWNILLLAFWMKQIWGTRYAFKIDQFLTANHYYQAWDYGIRQKYINHRTTELFQSFITWAVLKVKRCNVKLPGHDAHHIQATSQTTRSTQTDGKIDKLTRLSGIIWQ